MVRARLRSRLKFRSMFKLMFRFMLGLRLILRFSLTQVEVGGEVVTLCPPTFGRLTAPKY